MKNAIQSVEGYPGLYWQWCGLEDMGPVLMYDMLAMREAIFVVEQECIYQELDGRDKSACHLLVQNQQEVIACLRLLPPGIKQTHVRIGRVAVATKWRGQGIARIMMNLATRKAELDYPSSAVFLDAQTYLRKFYESIGFEACGDEFLEDGIPHVPMHKVINR